MARTHRSTGRLVLSRRAGERIFIGPVTVEISKINGQIVRLAIIAPQDMEIAREEVVDLPASGKNDKRGLA